MKKRMNYLLNMNVENYDEIDEIFDEIQYNIKYDENSIENVYKEYLKQFEL